VERAVNRRFNRRRHDATHPIAAFSARLQGEIDLDTLTVELLAVSRPDDTTTTVSWWLGPSASVPQNQRRRRTPRGVSADGSSSVRSHSFVKQAGTRVLHKRLRLMVDGALSVLPSRHSNRL
jgi:hypothetical protein